MCFRIGILYFRMGMGIVYFRMGIMYFRMGIGDSVL